MALFPELIKLGFLGFAVVVLIFSFWLLHGITSNPNLSNEGVSIRAREIRIYMAGSVLVLVLGLAWEFFNPKVSLFVDVHPNDMDGLLIRVKGQSIEWNKGKTEIQIPNGQEITLDLVQIDRKLRGTENYTREIKMTQLKEATGNLETKEAGL
ncbi:hypothetical protein [uncultured Desulfobulbus sp.]|uniref:hypothetical protein n=1 Tax=uncultured Desulfobulbus sp. TaxID=239745 RepID=UPI0029C78AF5|nr:hypothetical protein [uncultured Desulfobulbus sp.]